MLNVLYASKDLGGTFIAIVLIWYGFYKLGDWKPNQSKGDK